MVKVLVLACSALVAAALFSATSLATTGPGSRLQVVVKITDQKVVMGMYTLSDYAGPSEQFVTGPYDVTRGQVAQFIVWNTGKKEHNFTIFGKKTPNLKPGKRATFTVSLLRRGEFLWQSTLDKGKKGFKGRFYVG